MTLDQRVVDCIRSAMARRDLSQRDLAGILGWTQSRVAQKLTGRSPITVDELEALCFGVGIQPTEAVRDHGLEFCAEMTPTELRILERIRQLPPTVKDAVMTLLQVPSKTSQPERHARKRAAEPFSLPPGRQRA